jgi:hypothetical protein
LFNHFQLKYHQHMFKKILTGLCGLLLLAVLAFVIWGETPARPMPEALNALQSTTTYRVQTDRDWIEFIPAVQPKTTAIIFYPGGRVDYRAYAPLLAELAAQGYPTYLVRMPLNLAVFGINRADVVIAANPEVENWIIGGHSLGGAMAAQYASQHLDRVQGVLLLAAYATEGSDLSKSGLAVASISGNLDGLATPAKIQSAAAFLPDDTQWTTITGGNHAQMGWYGSQSGDNPAEISHVEQQKQVTSAVLTLIQQVEER